MHLTSAKNPFLQSVRRAVTSGRAMDDGRIVIEGPHLLHEVLRSRWTLDQLIVTPNGLERHSQLVSKIRADVTEIPARAFEALAGTETSQEIMALVTPPRGTWADILNSSGLTLVLDGIQDPGNAGTMVRSAEAFGAGGLVFMEGSVHAANGKFLRATAGSIFRLPYLENQKRPHLMAQLRSRDLKLYSLAAEAGTALSQVDLRLPCAIVVGNEASGVSPELRACSEGLRIPTAQVESLNAAVACSIVLFEAARQRGRL
jgi:RNA methyltransferase, TrmH family